MIPRDRILGVRLENLLHSRAVTVALGVIGVVLTALVCVAVYRMEYRAARAHFEREMELQASMLASEVTVLEKSLMSMREARALSDGFSAASFAFIADAHLQRQPLLDGVVWLAGEELPSAYVAFRDGRSSLPGSVVAQLRRTLHGMAGQGALMADWPGPLLLRMPAQQPLMIMLPAGPGAEASEDGAWVAVFELGALLDRVFAGLDRGACYRLEELPGEPQWDAAGRVLAENCPPQRIMFTRTFPVPGERQWQLTLSPGWNLITVSFLPWVTASVGLLMIVVVCGFLWMLQFYGRHTARLVAARTLALREANRRLESLSLTDPLTGLANRRAFDDRLANEWQRALRERTPVTLILLDVDYFKRLNDSYGHPAGDAVLEQLARLMEDAFRRPADLRARVGGEEFAVILPNTSQSVLASAERLRVMVASTPFATPEGLRLTVTVSLGVATRVPELGQACDVLFKAADEALYAAKANGRNRLVAAD